MLYVNDRNELIQSQMEHKRLVKVQFHDVLRTSGLLRTFGEFKDHLAKRYPETYGSNPLMMVYQEWPRKFSEQLFNPRRVIAKNTSNIEDLAQEYDSKSECRNVLCKYMGHHDKEGTYQQWSNTGRRLPEHGRLNVPIFIEEDDNRREENIHGGGRHQG